MMCVFALILSFVYRPHHGLKLTFMHTLAEAFHHQAETLALALVLTGPHYTGKVDETYTCIRAGGPSAGAQLSRRVRT